jgi:multicomponent Na+:H+ antiporter subunit B
VTSLILQATTRFMLPVLLLFSVFLLLRGHNSPGGGFAGGLVAAAAYTLYALAFGPAAAREAVRADTRRLIGVGLLVAAAGGAAGLLVGRPWFTGLWAHPGGVHLGTPLVFDVGVYLTVAGMVLTIILTLAEEE